MISEKTQRTTKELQDMASLRNMTCKTVENGQMSKEDDSFMGGVEQPWGKVFFHVLDGYLAMIIMFQVNSVV